MLQGKHTFQLIIFAILFFLLGAYFTPQKAYASTIPINYQGRLANANGALLTGSYNVLFCIYTSSSSTACTASGTTVTLNSAVYGEVYTSLSTSNGVFNVQLGSGANGSAGTFPSFRIDSGTSYYVGITVGTDSEMTPREQIEASSYAINAGLLDGFGASQTPGANTIPVLDTNGYLNFSTTNPQINATGSNTLTLQGGGETGNIQFFSGSNTLSQYGTLTLQGRGIFGNNVEISATGADALQFLGNGADINFGGTGANQIATNNQNLSLLPGTADLGINTTNPQYGLDVAERTTAFNSAKDGSIGSWTTSTNSLPVTFGLQDLSSAVSNGYVYILGGYDGASTYSTVYYAKINGSGGIGTWSTTTSLPVTLTYHSSVVVNSYLYAIGGRNTYSGGSVATVYFAKINADGTVGTWNATTSLPQSISSTSAVTANGYIYVLGGYSGGSELSTVYYAKVNANGTIGAWNTTTALAQGLSGTTADVANGYVYLLGGSTNQLYTGAVLTVSYAKINGNGTLGSWNTTTSLVQATVFGTSLVANGHMYIFGGLSAAGNFMSRVYDVPINADGTVGSWSAATLMPQGSSDATAVYANGYFYYIGGENSSAQAMKTVYYSQIATVSIAANLDLLGLTAGQLTGPNGDVGGSINAGNIYSNNNLQVAGNAQVWGNSGVNGNLTVNGSSVALNTGQNGAFGAWNTTTSLPVALSQISSATADGYVYVLGGYNGSSFVNTVYYAAISPSGTVGPWQTNAYPLPAALMGDSTIVANGYIYVLGGFNGSPVSTIYYAKINSNGGTGSWTTSLVSMPSSYSYGARSILYNGYIYLFGGQNGSDTTGVYSSQVNTDGSLSSWSTLNVLPATLSFESVTMANNYVYVIGGHNSTVSNQVNTVYYASLNSNGTVGTWVTDSANPLPAARDDNLSLAANGYIYVFSGQNNGTPYADDYYAPLNSDGSVGTWTTSAYPTPQPLHLYGLAYANGYAYVLGGNDSPAGGPQSTVYYTTFARTSVAGNLDLLGATSQSLTGPNGTVGGNLYAGNIYSNNNLEVSGNAMIWGNNVVSGNSIVNGTVQATSIQATSVNGSTISNNIFGPSNTTSGLQGTTVTITATAALNIAGKTTSLNANQDGSLGTFTTTTPLPSAVYTSGGVNGVYEEGVASANGYIYLVGGALNGNGAITTVEYANVNANGTTGSWRSGSSLPSAISYNAAIAYQGYLYTIGGYNGGAIATVYYAKINSDGSIGSWNTGSSLPYGSWGGQVFAADGYLYYIGGCDSGTAPNNCPASSTYYAKVNLDGSIGGWSGNTAIPTGEYWASLSVANGYIYLIGGQATGGTGPGGISITASYAKLASSGTIGSWTTDNTHTLYGTNGVARATSVVANGYLYVIGGYSNSTTLSSVIYSKLNGDGSIGNWTTNTTNLCSPVAQVGASILINGYIYTIGGANGSPTLNVCYTSTARTSIAGDLDLLGTTAVGGQISGVNGTVGGSIYAGNVYSSNNLEVAGNSYVWGNSNVNGTLTVIGDFGFAGHIVSVGTALSTGNVAVQAAAGTSATASVTSATDTKGSVSLTTGSASWASGGQVIISFATAYTTAPIVLLTPTNAAAATGMNARGVYVTSTASGFTINFANADTAANTYTWNYEVIQ